MSEEPFFTRTEGGFAPAPVARGPWAADMLHGRLLAGLLARQIEVDHGDPELQVSRLTVDLFRSPPMTPFETTSTLVREGNRIRVVDAVASSGGVDYARASAVMLRRTEQPPGNVWSPPPWDAPHPDELPEPPRLSSGGWPIPWETRSITRAQFGTNAQKRTWMREVREVVAGEPLTPLVRVATAADYTNPFANSGDQGLGYINADLTLYLARLPVDEWIGFEVSRHTAADGVAVGECTVYDTAGPIGTCVVCAVANRRAGRRS